MKLTKFLKEAFVVDECEQLKRLGFLVHDEFQGECLVHKLEDKNRGVFYVAVVKPKND